MELVTKFAIKKKTKAMYKPGKMDRYKN